MAYKKPKSIEEMYDNKMKRWDNSSLGAQIGGLIHDAVAIGIYAKDVSSQNLKAILDMLYDIAETKKKELTTIQPISHQDALRINEEYEEKMKNLKTEAERDELNRQAQELADKEMPVLEETEYTGEQQAERSFENKYNK